MLHLIVDGANVVGSRPDGWWRDRPGAARRLAGQLVATLSTDVPGLVSALGRQPSDDPGGEPDDGLRVHLVLEGAASRVEDLPTHPQLDVVHAPADGDAAIVELAAELATGGQTAEDSVLVVTADRELRDRVRASGASIVGPGTLLRALPG